ncbi:uncharacterized protein CLUP02_06426 [Colletotrichum lupini]|uniref:Uncharacterized protein n=1 Tax=Colletotrichum lupini TaxID=145971 RepID=A0A9Q8SPE3_9PEZI|nr:uncharacterized protein CLUP02_06426 [Colletotrichum lupini]UQC80940.1 hypothetical protein CLUP02_06426 [Colletotrichum lupini]
MSGTPREKLFSEVDGGVFTFSCPDLIIYGYFVCGSPSQVLRADRGLLSCGCGGVGGGSAADTRELTVYQQHSGALGTCKELWFSCLGVCADLPLLWAQSHCYRAYSQVRMSTSKYDELLLSRHGHRSWGLYNVALILVTYSLFHNARLLIVDFIHSRWTTSCKSIPRTDGLNSLDDHFTPFAICPIYPKGGTPVTTFIVENSQVKGRVDTLGHHGGLTSRRPPRVLWSPIPPAPIPIKDGDEDQGDITHELRREGKGRNHLGMPAVRFTYCRLPANLFSSSLIDSGPLHIYSPIPATPVFKPVPPFQGSRPHQTTPLPLPLALPTGYERLRLRILT